MAGSVTHGEVMHPAFPPCPLLPHSEAGQISCGLCLHHPAQLCVICMLTLSLHVCALVSRQVTLGKVLKVIVVMRSLFIDRTIVKGYNESVYTEDGKVSGLESWGGVLPYSVPEQSSR